MAKEYRNINPSDTYCFSVSKDERDKAKQEYIDFVDGKSCLKCHMGVWDEGLDQKKDQRLYRVNKVNRRDKCFFFHYDPSMMFTAAKELQKRQQEYKQLKKSNMYTRIGLWIAASALFANVIIELIRLKSK
ncbi:MAG: hypothetical protein ABSA77_01135 [Thermoguttaceae bacterium]